MKLTDLVCLGCEFEVRSFDDCINGASFLAEATVNAFCHVDVVPVRGSLDHYYTRNGGKESVWLVNLK